jgi:CheY-like chemotaxis protein
MRWGHDLTLVALTGWGQEADKSRARESGFDHHLTKPVTFQLLDRLLRSATGAGG